MMLILHSVNSDRLFNTRSRVLQADWFILEITGVIEFKESVTCFVDGKSVWSVCGQKYGHQIC